MESFDLKGVYKKPTTEELNKELSGIERATIAEEELDAKKIGLTKKEYKELNKLSTYSVEYKKGEDPTVENFIKKWEKESNVMAQYEYEQLDMNMEIINNTPYSMSNFFLSAVVRLAREKIWSDHSQKYPKRLLNNLLDVSKIEIKKINGTNNLKFDIYINKKYLFSKKHTEIVFLEMFPDGNFKLD